MAVRYRAITRVGRFYGKLVESVKRYSESFDHIIVPNYGEIAGIQCNEGGRNVAITFAKLEGVVDNALLIAMSLSQDSNILAADRFEELTGIDLRPASSEFCRFIEEGLNESLDVVTDSLRIISALNKQNLAGMCSPSLN